MTDNRRWRGKGVWGEAPSVYAGECTLAWSPWDNRRPRAKIACDPDTKHGGSVGVSISRRLDEEREPGYAMEASSATRQRG